MSFPLFFRFLFFFFNISLKVDFDVAIQHVTNCQSNKAILRRVTKALRTYYPGPSTDGLKLWSEPSAKSKII